MIEKINIQLEQNTEAQKTAEFGGGEVDYSVVGEATTEKNPVIIVPGFTVGRLVQRNFASVLHEQGQRQVIFSEQPDFSYMPSMKPVIDRHAEALLAIVKAEELEMRAVDFVTHSFGSMIFVRAAELAKARGLKSFEAEKGSHAIFVSPAGSSSEENIVRLGGRFATFMINGTPLGKELDPTGEWMKAGTKNFVKRPIKTVREIAVLRKKEAIYKKLGVMGIKPVLIGYHSDDLMPFSISESVFMDEDFAGGGYSVPVDTASKPLASNISELSLKKYTEVSGLDKKEAAKTWARHHLGAGHNDLLFNPERTVRAILPVLDDSHLQIAQQGHTAEMKTTKPSKKVNLTL